MPDQHQERSLRRSDAAARFYERNFRKTARDSIGATVSGATTDKRTAHIAAVAVVLGALLGAGATASGSIISGIYAASASDRQISAEETRTTQEFLRTQQKQVYASFIAADEELTRSEAQVPYTINHRPPSATYRAQGGLVGTLASILSKADLERLERLEREVLDGYDRLRKISSEIALIASPATAEAAAKVDADHFTFLAAFYSSAPMATRSIDQSDKLEEQRGPFSGIGPEPTLAKKFLDAARADLGSSN